MDSCRADAADSGRGPLHARPLEAAATHCAGVQGVHSGLSVHTGEWADYDREGERERKRKREMERRQKIKELGNGRGRIYSNTTTAQPVVPETMLVLTC